MSFSIEEIEFYLCILVRTAAFVYTAPFFTLKNVPQRVKLGFCLSFALLMFEAQPYERLLYASVIDYAAVVLKEVLAGLLMGFFANAAYHILAFTGHILDMEMGFSMVQQFDQVSGTQVTITANLYSYAVMAVLIIGRMHLQIISIFALSFEYIPIGQVYINPLIYEGFLGFLIGYFDLGFRIALPMFAAMLIVNVVLAVLARVAPQMNMFVIGIQIKVLVGFAVLLLMIGMLRNVSDYIYYNMENMFYDALRYLKIPE